MEFSVNKKLLLAFSKVSIALLVSFEFVKELRTISSIAPPDMNQKIAFIIFFESFKISFDLISMSSLVLSI